MAKAPNEAYAVLHHRHYLCDALHCLVYTVVGYNRSKEIGYLLVRLAQYILVVEPNALLEVELGTRL